MVAGNPQVLVAGAGPVGLTLASELCRHGARCRIVDPLAAPTGWCKAIGIQPRTLEVWEDMGLVEDAIRAGIWIRGAYVFKNGALESSTDISETDPERDDAPYGALALPQDETERLLTRHLSRLGVEIERGVALAGFRELNEGIEAELQQGDGRREVVRASYLVGCDGAHSTVRKTLGLSFEGGRFEERYMLGDVELDGPLEPGHAYRFLELEGGELKRLLVAIPLPGARRFRVSMQVTEEVAAALGGGGAEHGMFGDRPGPSQTQLQQVIDEMAPAGTRIRHLRWSSIFAISHRIASAYGGGRAFLAGDAAHIHPPTGAQGMNTGIQDAYNLAWKLALVVRGEGHPALLESYDVERRPIGRDVVEGTREAAIAQQHGDVPSGAAMVQQVSQLGVNYRGSAWVGESVGAGALSGPRAGDRAPDARGLRAEGRSHAQRLFERLRGTESHLLAFLDGSESDDDLERLKAMACAAHERFADRVVCQAIWARGTWSGTRPPHDLIGWDAVSDSKRRFALHYGATRGSAYLIRPDGYVGFRAEPLDAGALVAHVERILRPRRSAEGRALNPRA